MPAHDLLFRPVGVGDGFVVNAVLPDGISFGSLHDSSLRILRTEVRCNGSRSSPRFILVMFSGAFVAFLSDGVSRHGAGAVRPGIGNFVV